MKTKTWLALLAAFAVIAFAAVAVGCGDDEQHQFRRRATPPTRRSSPT